MRVRFLLFSLEGANRLSRRLTWIGKTLSNVFYNTKYDLKRAELPVSAEQYLTACFLSALLYGLFFFALLAGIFYVREQLLSEQSVVLSAALSLLFFFLFFGIHLVYPGLLAKQVAAGIDQNLLFALKGMQVQVTSGVSLYDAMVNASKGNFGVVSNEFEGVVKDVSAGLSESQALERLALKTKSDYLKKTCWQLLTSMQSGASIQGALNSVVSMLMNHQFRSIKDYAAELNLWILLYLLLATAVPTLGITFMVILSSLSGSSIGPSNIYGTVLASFLFQAALIGFIKTRIPRVYL